MKKYKIILFIIGFIFFFLVFLLWFFSAPKIDYIEPELTEESSVVTIRGKNFQSERNEGFVSIDEKKIPINTYLSWNNKEIKIKFNNIMDSGFLTVTTYFGTSNYKLITKKQNIEIENKNIFSTKIYENQLILERDSIININGENILLNKDAIQVFFPTLIDENTKLKKENYISWSQNSIQIKVPEFIKENGDIVVKTRQQEFRIPYTLKDEKNKIVLLDKKQFQIEEKNLYSFEELDFKKILNFYSFSIKIEQYKNQIVEYNFQHDYKDYNGLKFINIEKKGNKELIDTLKVTSFAYEVLIEDFNLISKNYKKDEEYIKNTQLLKRESDIQKIIENIKNEYQEKYSKNNSFHPFEIAKNLYSISYNQHENESIKNSYTYYVYNIALLENLKLQGIPSVLINTYQLTNNKLARGYYIEFYLQGFMWIPIELNKEGFAKVSSNHLILYKGEHAQRLEDFIYYEYKDIVEFENGYFDLIIYKNGNKIKDIKNLYKRIYSINEKNN